MTAHPHHFVASSPKVVQALMRVVSLTADVNEQAEVIDMAATAFMCGVTERGMTALGKAYAAGRLTTEILRQLGRDLDTSPAMFAIAKQAHAQAQAERDAELGRWRWPEQPDFVVYRLESEDDTSGRYVEVLHEPDAKTTGMWEDMLSCGSGNEFAQAARAYFDAHPEPKPWHGAKHEEVWLVTANGDTGPMLATYGPDSPREGLFTQLVAANGARFDVDDPGITAARRIWPEETP